MMNRINWMSQLRVESLWLLSTLVALSIASTGSAQTLSNSPRRDFWITDDDVHCLAQNECTLYVGGAFTFVGPNTGPFAAINAVTGQAIPPFAPTTIDPTPGTPRRVYAVASDGAGGWFIGGDFLAISGMPRSRLAHVFGNGALDPTWAPAVDSAGAEVYGFALSGSTLFLCGSFNTINGQPRKGLAALDAATGALLPWNPNANIGSTGICVSGNTVYAVGAFTSIGGQPRNRIAALDATTAAATPWDPNADFTVNTVAVSGNTVFVSGTFSNIGGQARYRMAAIDATTGLATAFNPNPNSGSEVKAIAVSGNTVYAGGSFSTIGGQSRGKIAALDANSGAATAWNPSPSATVVYAVTVSGTTVYVGGFFTTMGGQSRRNIAALDATIDLNNATAWNPGASADVYSIAASGGVVYVGGGFKSIGGKNRNRIAAFDLATGMATDWNPSANNTVFSMALSGTTLYVGGDFSIIGGFGRQNIAALNTTLNTSNATAWSPFSSDRVLALEVDGNTIYAGGRFTSIGGQPRNRIAALNATINTNNATAWNPNANNYVDVIRVSGSTIYAGGSFTNIGGQSRSGIASLDAISGTATTWNPNAAGTLGHVYDIIISNNTIYAGGYYDSIGGQIREGLAALDATTGSATPWDPGTVGTPGIVNAMAMGGNNLYVGGTFSAIGGLPHIGLSVVDTGTALPTLWTPDLSAFSLGSEAITYLGGRLCVGGGEFTMHGIPRYHLAVFDLLGDMNCDGELNGNDIDDFVVGVTDPAGYATAHPCCNISNGDFNDDGNFDAEDGDSFVINLLNAP